MNKEELANILELHKKWIMGETGGKRADLRDAVLCNAVLCNADLRGADLRGAVLCRANLHGCKTDGVIYNENTAGFTLVCPEKGSYIGYKKVNGLIVELMIPEDAKRSSATSRKCRASKAVVVSITNPDGSSAGKESVASEYDPNFVYTVGVTVEVKDFCADRWIDCAPGIHHFITRGEAVMYE